MFKFAKYKSIEKVGSSSLNKQIQQFQQALEKQGRNINDIEFVAFEKIHGANFSFIITEEEEKNNDNNKNQQKNNQTEKPKKLFQACKRSGIINEDEKFNQYEQIKEKYQENLENFYDILKELKNQEGKKVIQIQIFGEIYGGNYKHPDIEPIEGVKPVQKGVYYCSFIEFQAFDCSVIFENSKQQQKQNNQNQEETKENIKNENQQNETDVNEIQTDKEYLYMEDFLFLCEKSGLPFVQPLKKGKLNELNKFDVENFESEIYKRYNLPKIEHNIAEGVILRPLKEYHGPLIKIKADKFYEKAGGKKGTESEIEQKQLQNRGNEKKKEKSQSEFLMDLKLFFTFNRLESVLSKLNDQEKEKSPQNQKALVLLLINDALEDFLKENEENKKYYDEIKNKEENHKQWKKFNQTSSAQAFQIVNQYINEK